MKNKPYPYYDVPQMNDMKDMLLKKAALEPNLTAFVFAEL